MQRKETSIGKILRLFGLVVLMGLVVFFVVGCDPVAKPGEVDNGGWTNSLSTISMSDDGPSTLTPYKTSAEINVDLQGNYQEPLSDLLSEWADNGFSGTGSEVEFSDSTKGVSFRAVGVGTPFIDTDPDSATGIRMGLFVGKYMDKQVLVVINVTLLVDAEGWTLEPSKGSFIVLIEAADGSVSYGAVGKLKSGGFQIQLGQNGQGQNQQ